MISASSLDRLEQCPSAGALAQVRTPSSADAARGTAIHAYVENALYKGRTHALSLVPDDLRATCEGIDLEHLFGADGGLVSCEVPLAYDVATDAARFLERGDHRSYRDVRAGEIPGTVDVVETWGDPVERVRVSDIKTGFAYVPSDTLQLAFYGLAVARIFGVEEVTVRIVQLDERGGAKVDERTYDAFDLLGLAGRVADTFARVQAARDLVARSLTPSVALGEHCTYCPSTAACPGRSGLARAVLSELSPEAVRSQLAAATPEQVGAWWARLEHFLPAVEEMQKGLKALVDSYGEVPLPDGRKVVSKQTPVRSIDGKVALPILREALGEKAEGLVSPKITLVEIEKAAGEMADELIARIDAAGGIHQKTIRRHATVGKAKAV